MPPTAYFTLPPVSRPSFLPARWLRSRQEQFVPFFLTLIVVIRLQRQLCVGTCKKLETLHVYHVDIFRIEVKNHFIGIVHTIINVFVQTPWYENELRPIEKCQDNNSYCTQSFSVFIFIFVKYVLNEFNVDKSKNHYKQRFNRVHNRRLKL